MSIKNKLVIIISFLIIVPLIVMGGASYLKSSEALNDSILEANKSLNSEIANSLKNEVDGYMMGVKSIAANNDAKEILNKPEYEPFLLSLFKHYVKNFDHADKMYIGTKDGQMRSEPFFNYDESYDPRVRSWYKLAKEIESFVWTDMYQSASTGKWQISGAAPVYDLNDEFIGAVSISLDLTNISQKINEIQVGERGYVFILDDKGNVVAHKDKAQIGKKMGSFSYCVGNPLYIAYNY